MKHPTLRMLPVLMRRFATLTLSLALLAAACSDDDGHDDAAASAQIMARVEAIFGEQTPLDPGEVAIPEGCRLVIETDEYGFETEGVACDGDPGATTPAADGGDASGLSTWGGSGDARSVARNLRRVLVEQTGCDGPQDLIALENLVHASPAGIRAPLQAAMADLNQSADLCNVDVAGWHQALESALNNLEKVIGAFEETVDG